MKVALLALVAVVSASAASAQSIQPLAPLAPVEPATDERSQDIVELGKLLFFDARLSGDSSTSCAECHNPSSGWSDGSELSRGYPGTQHWRNAQTIINTGFLTEGFHWDAGLGSLEDQIVDAFGASFVASIRPELAEERLLQIPVYRERFQALWGEDPTMQRISTAIAAYERTLVSTDSPFDAYMRGEQNTFSDAAKRGKALFEGKAGCISCHNGALATDQAFHNTSVPPNPSMAEEPLRQVTFRVLMREIGIAPDIFNALDRDPGRFLGTGKPQDLGAFRTAPLRYLIHTPPYMHNGVFYDLKEVVEFYNNGGTEDVFGTKSPLIVPLGMNDAEVDDLVAFLESMSGSIVRDIMPELPDYEVREAEANLPPITMASLTERFAKEQAAARKRVLAQQQTETQQQSQASTQQNGTSGLLIISKNDASSASVSFQTAPSSESAAKSAEGSTALVSTSDGFSVVTPGASVSTVTSSPATNEVATEPAQPAIASAPAAVKSSDRIVVDGTDRFVIVQAGDTLGRIAIAVYGDARQFRKIYEANRAQIADPNLLIAGARLRIP